MTTDTIDAPNVRQWLQFSVSAQDQFVKQHEPTRLMFDPSEKWILENGVPMGPRISVEEAGVANMEAKMCFQNAFQTAVYSDGQFTYCEGWAYTPGLIACQHAWVIDAEGRVVDPTWHDSGDFCSFCIGEKTKCAEICEECEEDSEFCPHTLDELMEIGTYSEEIPCRWCNGSGKDDQEHRSREGTEYLGVAVPEKLLIKIVFAKQTYGVLPEGIDQLRFVKGRYAK